ncbi:hypothetical protein BURK_005287 [Burkholderia sp. SJ98]|uniref:hypothetical protein n=1 Tax=Caballeronia zhejiangensis TaxID=871203 RepID=UPI00025BA005|nr:hypothetical protein [Caballeronia zhejiangensis]EKS72428.1 hypothetical protein BURK_005287 [Burkholderia sp. SJ98]
MALNPASLARLTTALVNVLKASDGVEANHEVTTGLVDVIRKLRILRELDERYYIAVAGSQGAGKTRLIRELYELDDTWLKDNEGRGEQLPVFIVETEEVDKPVGVVQTIDTKSGQIEETRLDAAAFRKCITNYDGSGLLFPKLLVRPRHFSGAQTGFVLLPGYEMESEQNTAWQQLMRGTLRLALGTVIVTDAGRLAESGQLAIMKDLSETCLAQRKPIIVATKTENADAAERARIVERAAEVFEVPATERDERIVTTGVGEREYVSGWSRSLLAGLNKYALRAADADQVRVDDLLDLLGNELRGLHERLESALMDKAVISGVAERQRASIIEQFRESAASYRRKYEVELRRLTRDYANRAQMTAKKRYRAEEVGITNKLRQAKDFLMLRSGVDEEAHVKRIVESWQEPGDGEGPRNLIESHFTVLSKMAKSQLHIESGGTQDTRNATTVLPMLGYESGPLVEATHGRWAEPGVQTGLRRVLDSTSMQTESLENEDHESLQAVVKLIPAITMEFMRINQSLLISEPEIRATLKTPEELGMEAQRLGAKFGTDVSESLRTVLRAVACVFAVDVAIDGVADIPQLIGSIFGAAATATGVGHTLSLVASGVVAGGFIVHSAITQVHQYDAARLGYIGSVMEQLMKEHVAQQLGIYDDIMEQIGERMHRTLAVAYRLDTALGFRDQLLRGLAALDRARLTLMSDIRDRQALA